MIGAPSNEPINAWNAGNHGIAFATTKDQASSTMVMKNQRNATTFVELAPHRNSYSFLDSGWLFTK